MRRGSPPSSQRTGGLPRLDERGGGGEEVEAPRGVTVTSGSDRTRASITTNTLACCICSKQNTVCPTISTHTTLPISSHPSPPHNFASSLRIILTLRNACELYSTRRSSLLVRLESGGVLPPTLQPGSSLRPRYLNCSAGLRSRMTSGTVGGMLGSGGGCGLQSG